MDISDFVVHPGKPEPIGLSFNTKQANFSVFSHSASQMTLGIRHPDGRIFEFPMHRTGDLWHLSLEGIEKGMDYAFRTDPGVWLADPASRTLTTGAKWGQGIESVWSRIETVKPFDWQGVQKPSIPKSELVIYEMHVRSFTAHPSSSTAHPGTYLGLIEKIPYLRKLGVNAIELMPIFEFDETRTNPKAPGLKNTWGYDPLHFFSPMRRYAGGENPIEEFKTLVRELHRNKIEILLDVVYNHTGEEDDRNYRFSFRGLDDSAYYMLDEHGRYRDYAGCKNTVNANHPAVMNLILDSLRFWADEMQVDGFRFDLASVLTRGQNGEVLQTPPLLEAIGKDPILKHVKLIAESWDASGLYQVGHFPHFGAWSEWNDKFRDRVRRFFKGDGDTAGKFADVLSGSEFLYRTKSPACSINFVTAHDGFSLHDLVSYNQKHNEANGQMNRDGNNQNYSWNCGVEGPTQDPHVHALRERHMRNFLLTLFLSQGIPMLLMGDEYGHTRKGNNNPYVQDNEINWFLWDVLQKREDRFDFVSSLIAFRKNHPAFKRTSFLSDADVDWHGSLPNQADWSTASRFVACTLKSNPLFYLAFNADSEPKQIQLPNGQWKEIVRTDRPWNEHHLKHLESGPLIQEVLLPAHTSLLAASRPF
jgi:isoamylase/glycogen operon protein